MVTPIEVGLVLVLLALLVGAYKIVKAVKPFVWNAVVGLIVFVLADLLFGLSVAITPLTLLVVAIAGVPGALLVILLSYLEVAFVAGLFVF
ncbi:pro-sigmaK processing inhibitor BofA family protein [Halapricum hydrolyticum]|uniref:Pro-sigmaK processing inhibitor BofA family protein n=1 Tax=Halapricum hydrolyticum TaxID=2979991 RepID=A0AAE3I8Q1_9EURY|nr:pro-sigmaK processing inhibitor BofA family protein [Halapricum hydrolyticum]MCU4716997.1 pro-sigmaK processing inhibitor BofA family protein [Halapricum hydrolyticum]MCU4725397.1 pro-sigmaK processing inhibitor BofA family protein [Halapricum hydrolyticum]